MAKEYLDKTGLSYFWQRIKDEIRINEESASGSPAIFSDASTLPVKSLSVSINAVQSGSGDPSPDNMREITGWDAVNVYVSGKNIFALGRNAQETTIRGVTFTPNADGSITVNGTATADINLNLTWAEFGYPLVGLPHAEEAYSVTFSLQEVIGPSYVGIGYIDRNLGAHQFGSIRSGAKYTATMPKDAMYLRCYLHVNSGVSVSNAVVKIQAEFGTEATEWVPSVGTVYPISLPQTVYGGVLDVTSGTLTVTKKMVDMGTLPWSYLSSSNIFISVLAGSKPEINLPILTPIYKQIPTRSHADMGNADDNTIAYYISTGDTSGRIKLKNTAYTTVDAFTSAMSGIPLVYPLATPLTLSLTPTEVRTILGYNNIYADSGEVDVVYYRDNIASSNDGFFGAADKEKLDRLNLPVLQTKEYTGIIGSANDAAGATFYFANVIPDDYYKQWKVHYRVTASVPGQNAYNQVSECTMGGDNSSYRFSRNENSNTDTRSFYYNCLYRATKTGCDNGYGHVLGVGLRSSNNPTNASYKRDIKIELLGCEGCTVTLWDEMKKYASIPGTGSTNYTGLTETDAFNGGYKQTGDNNYYDRTYVANFNPKAGAGGLKQYALFMEDSSGTFQSLTTTNGTGTSKTKNTTGFKPGRIWCLSSGSNFTSGTSAGANTAYIIVPFDVRYSFNLTANLTAHEPVYLVGTIGSDGLFYLDDVWHTQTLPTTEDGKMYIYLGLAYSATGAHLAPDHPMYWYKNGAVRLWPDGMEGASSAVSGVKGNAETTYRTGNVNLTPANIGAVNKTGDSMTGNLVVTNDSGASTVVNVSHGEHHVSLYANDDYVGLYSSDKPGMIIYEDTTGDKQLQPVASTSNNGFMSAADKTKLNGIGANAQPVTGMAADGSAPSIASGTTFVDLQTDIALAANHRYLCTYTVQWSSNATGRRAAKAMIGTNEVGVISQSIIAPANGAVTIHGATFWIQSSTSARTLKIQGYQNSGSTLTATVRYQLIDFGTA